VIRPWWKLLDFEGIEWDSMAFNGIWWDSTATLRFTPLRTYGW
jgi:hypothetical protein